MFKLNCYTKITDNIDTLKGMGILSDERIEEVKKWVAPEAFTEVKLASGKTLKGWRLHELTSKMYNENNFVDKNGAGYVARQIFDELLTQEEIERINKFANFEFSSKIEMMRFEKAIKIPQEEYDGWVYKEGCGYNEGFFDSVESYLDFEMDFAMENDAQWNGGPTYLWATKGQPVCHINLDKLIERITEDTAYEDYRGPVGLEELKKAVDIFNSKNEQDKSYDVDYSRAVILNS